MFLPVKSPVKAGEPEFAGYMAEKRKTDSRDGWYWTRERCVMDDELKIKVYSFTVDCKDPYELAKFYAKMLKWEIAFHDENWACLCPPGAHQGSYTGITFQRNAEYKPPVWPTEPGTQQQMAHLDFAVNDLESAVQYAVHCGARIADKQFSCDWRVMLDPSGHPFCLCQMKPIFGSPHFALL